MHLPQNNSVIGKSPEILKFLSIIKAPSSAAIFFPGGVGCGLEGAPERVGLLSPTENFPMGAGLAQTALELRAADAGAGLCVGAAVGEPWLSGQQLRRDSGALAGGGAGGVTP